MGAALVYCARSRPTRPGNRSDTARHAPSPALVYNRIMSCLRRPVWFLFFVAGCLDTVDESAWEHADCGELGKPCCVGSTCSRGNCVAGICLECGGLGQTCCAGRQCADGLCTGTGSGSCIRCGGSGEACCPGNNCDNGRCCVSSVCTAVGATCPGIGGVCADGSCGSCGGGESRVARTMSVPDPI